MSTRPSVQSIISNALSPTLESAQTELEHVWWGRLKDPKVLEGISNSSMEHHLQWDIRLNDPKGTIRARRIGLPEITGDDYMFSYVQCIKIKKADAGQHELETSIDEDMFHAIQNIATQGMCKLRYTIPVAGDPAHIRRKWEIDLMMDENNNYTGIVKVELEIESPDETIPPFPIEFDELLDPRDQVGIDAILEQVLLKK